MAWWRHDPSLLTRSPIHRYAQRVLRNHEAVLRTRCFSRTPSKGAQHEDESGSKRPPSVSDIEWTQLQHYYRWRKRLQVDPYRAIFGASEDMLKGKGLIDWDWINKSFPRWMLNEVDMREESQGRRESATTARESTFPQPSFRKLSLDRDGIQSPSDSRRPQEGSHVKEIGKATSERPKEEPVASSSTTFTAPDSLAPLSTSAPSCSNNSSAETGSQEVLQKDGMNGTLNDEASDSHELKRAGAPTQSSPREPIRDRTRDELPRSLSQLELDNWNKQTSDYGSRWRQTALQRHGLSPSMRKQLTMNAERLGYAAVQPEQDASSYSVRPSTGENESATQSTSEKLKQLPKDDMDFLSAADIRATMGSKRGWLPTNEQKEASRQNLERAFNGNEETSSIHPMLEARIVNNQYVRRTERKLRDEQLARETKVESPEGASVVEPSPDAPSDAPSESSIERMKRWLETTGASFAKTFWQDPTEEADVTKTKLFFDKVAHYVKKGQAANRQITEDLRKDIPVSKALLSRLKRDEERLDLAIHRLRQRTSSEHTQDLSPRKIRAMESLKVRFHQTNHELETAYEELRGLVGTESAANATGSFKRRLTAASKVLHKNSQLLRMLIWSLQTRLEDPKIDRKILPNYKVVADNLLSLRDTQMTLMRLVDRAMLVYGVVPAGPADDKAARIELADIENCEDPFVRARLAADVHLINEIRAHQSGPREVSNDNSPPAQEPNSNKVRDEPSPLMNSLFRPFGPAIEKLGNRELRESAAEKASQEEKRKLGDLNLVDEIKAAYEDTYGSITVNHKQDISDVSEVLKPQRASAEFQELKDDPASRVGSFDKLADPTYHMELSAQDGTAAMESAAALCYPVEVLTKPATTTTENTTAVELPSGNTNTNESTQAQGQSESAQSTASATPASTAQGVQGAKEQKETTPVAATEHLSTHYTILVRDSGTDTMSITTSTTGPPRDTSPAVPLHLALSSLDHPAKFIPHIMEGLEVVSAKKDILVLRDAVESPISIRSFNTIRSSSTVGGPHAIFNQGATNPIDGTTRLSPTGYVGPEESAEQLEKEFQERRHAADIFNHINNTRNERVRMATNHRKAKRKGTAGSVVKTAIWVAGVCYVAGVIGEIATGGV